MKGGVYFGSLVNKEETEWRPTIIITKEGSKATLEFTANFHVSTKEEAYAMAGFIRKVLCNVEGVGEHFCSPEGTLLEDLDNNAIKH